MRLSRAVRLLVVVGSLAFVPVLASCSPGYVMRGAYEQGKILLGRRDIQEVLQDPAVPEDDRAKLQLVLDAREYAALIGLKPGGSFTSYSDIGKDTLSWVVVGARKDSFSLYTWWFPIVGEVPYKGFFDQEDAKQQAKELEAEGFETWVRGTDAFSTLGWFDDPVLSTTLKNPPTRIANTVIHESVHSTVWIKGSVAFNESLANFVGSQGAVLFFAERLAECRAAGKGCDVQEQQLASATREYAFQFELADVVDALYDRLDQLYRDPSLSSEEKISRRGAVFNEVMTPFRQKFPTVNILKEVNNADIIQLKLYLSKLWLFHELFVRKERDWRGFMNAVREIQKKMDSNDGPAAKDPFNVLQEIVGTKP